MDADSHYKSLGYHTSVHGSSAPKVGALAAEWHHEDNRGDSVYSLLTYHRKYLLM
jgi:hypothetical protein